MLQLILHLFGDYILQSDWMAATKTKRSIPCFVHCITYTIPFFILTNSAIALLFIFSSHFLLDRFRLVRYLIWFKNELSPWEYRRPWDECSVTGYPNNKPSWLSVWLMIAADNACHLALNYIAIHYL